MCYKDTENYNKYLYSPIRTHTHTKLTHTHTQTHLRMPTNPYGISISCDESVDADENVLSF
jgi:hypothetical protein